MTVKTLSGEGTAVPPVRLFDTSIEFAVDSDGDMSDADQRALGALVDPATFAALEAQRNCRIRMAVTIDRVWAPAAAPRPAQPLSPTANQGRQEEQLGGEGGGCHICGDATHRPSQHADYCLYCEHQRSVHVGGMFCTGVLGEHMDRACGCPSFVEPAPLPEKQSPPPAPPADPEGAMRVALVHELAGWFRRGPVRALLNTYVADQIARWAPRAALAHPPADSAGAGETTKGRG